jgi:ABC-type transport system involved in cytochrome c biogenesis permease component
MSRKEAIVATVVAVIIVVACLAGTAVLFLDDTQDGGTNVAEYCASRHQFGTQDYLECLEEWGK